MTGLIFAAVSMTPVATNAAVLKAVFIVGPTGPLTPLLLEQAERAARLAEAAGVEVVRAYTPNATWPVVRDAAAGASIVVYMGHGYGFPSPYRSALYPLSHNGFGLNPIAGSGDDTHQYWGEAYVDDLDLAPNAVVLLHHLCYASGNSETGVPEGTREVAIQRVDNFAAGFLRAGAAAVIAEAHSGPAYYVDALLNSSRTIAEIWQASPQAHGNEFAVTSSRTPGFTARLDPARPDGGYFRSMVSRGDVPAAAVRDGAMGNMVTSPAPFPAEPSLTTLGLEFGVMTLESPPIAGTTARVVVPLLGDRRPRPPSGIHLGLRWDPIVIDSPVVTAAPAESAAPAGIEVASPTAAPAESAAPAGIEVASPTPEATPYVPPEIDLVVPEALGAVVNLSAARYRARGLVATVPVPVEAGLYRLVPTLHNEDSVAYDQATQVLLTTVLVRVTGPVAVAFSAPASIDLTTSQPSVFPIRVANVGAEAWELVVPNLEPPSLPNSPAELVVLPAHLVATWVSMTDQPVPPPISIELTSDQSAPGSDEVIDVPLVSPVEPGSYLLLVDVISAVHGPLSAVGPGPTMARVIVAAPEPPLDAELLPSFGPGRTGVLEI